MGIRFTTLVLFTELLKVVGLIVVLVLGSKTECSSKPLDLFPWIILAAVAPLALVACYILLVLLGFAIYCCDKGLYKSMKKQRGCFNSGFWAITTLVWDVFSVTWLCIGIALTINLNQCPELDAAICGLVYLFLLGVRSMVISIMWCYNAAK